MEIDKAYNPQDKESKIYREWENKGYFNPDNLDKKGEKAFSIVLPPPNVTGTLHLGHASMLAIEDLMVRYKRMHGFDTVWIPGTDHAAIATQNVVEKKIYIEEKKTRHDLGREEFLKRVADYAEKSKSTIHNQIRKMGSSLDWSREAYTLDEVRNKAVKKVFKMMYDDGLIYRGYRIVNWCPRCHTTLADDEIQYKETKSKLYWIKYGPFVLATTRPETKLGDTAVAVNPNDDRYKDMVGKKYMIPGVLGEFEVTVIADEAVDPEFGSGAVKVTPGHSVVDYEMALRHNIKVKKIIDEDGKMMDNCGKYAGMTTLEAREAIVADMQKMGLIEKIDEGYENKLSVCYRCKTVVEPLPSAQWFIDVNKKITKKGNKYFKNGASLKEVSLKVVKEGEIKIIPERFEKTYYQWMENLRDWCVSRQIWFGHRIPVWYKKEEPQLVLVSRHGEAETNAEKYLDSNINRITDVLTKKGIADITADAERLKKEGHTFDIIFASDFERTKQTAEIFANAFGSKIILDKRLREIDMGEFDGQPDLPDGPFIKLRQNFEAWHHDNPQGIESFDSLKTRVYSILDDIKTNYKDKKVLIVTHGDPTRVIQGYGTDLSDEEIFNLGYPPVGAQFWVDLSRKKERVVTEEALDTDIWQQDEDTLDTWFSSGLWTFTTLLPKDWDGKEFVSKDIKRFHPTTVLETGYDIIFFWVARMILMTTYVLGEVPFENVYLHGLIRDKDGEKMSKSKPETAIDPVEAGEKYGFDAVRLSLLIGNTAGNDIRLYDEKIEGYRNFVNKLWNVSRFILTSVADISVDTKKIKGDTLADKWILSRFNTLKREVTKLLDEYNFSQAGEILRDFTWYELADWYLEIAKVEKNKDAILMHLLKEVLAMWHPFVPFVTEEIWSTLKQEKSLIISSWPEVDKKYIDSEAERQFEAIKQIIVGIRNVRAQFNIPYTKQFAAFVVVDKKDNQKILDLNKEVILKSVKLDSLATELVKNIADFSKPDGYTSAGVVDLGGIYVDLSGVVDTNKEKERLQKELEGAEKYFTGLERKLSNSEYVKNAPANIVEADRVRLQETQEKIAKLKAQIAELK